MEGRGMRRAAVALALVTGIAAVAPGLRAQGAPATQGAPAAQGETELARGSGSTVTRAAYGWRITRDAADSPCKVLQQPACRSTRFTISNPSKETLACTAQIYFHLGATPDTPSFTENFGLQVEPGATALAFENEVPQSVDAARSFAVCWTLAERDEADDGDAPFARSPPGACTVTRLDVPQLDDFYPTVARRDDEQGLVLVRLALPDREGFGKVLGLAQSSGSVRIDRAAMLAASRMRFRTNCPATQRTLPLRFQLTE